jgi:hypothetical protein
LYKAKKERTQIKDLNQGSAVKKSRNIYFSEKSYDFHGKLDFLNFDKTDIDSKKTMKKSQKR